MVYVECHLQQIPTVSVQVFICSLTRPFINLIFTTSSWVSTLNRGEKQAHFTENVLFVTYRKMLATFNYHL